MNDAIERRGLRARDESRWCRVGSRRTDDSGAALVEFAIVFPVLFMLLIGMVTGGISYARHNAINNAARETSRYGATLPLTSEASYLNALLDEAKAAATGDLDSSVDAQRLCVAYVYEDGTTPNDRTVSLTEVAGVRGAPSFSKCFTDNPRPDDERHVQVQLQRDTDIEGVFWTHTVTITARSVSRYERAE